MASKTSAYDRYHTVSLPLNEAKVLLCGICFEVSDTLHIICTGGDTCCFSCLVSLRMGPTPRNNCPFCEQPLFVSLPSKPFRRITARIKERMLARDTKKKLSDKRYSRRKGKENKRRKANKGGVAAPTPLERSVEVVTNATVRAIRRDRALASQLAEGLKAFGRYEAFDEFIHVLRSGSATRVIANVSP